MSQFLDFEKSAYTIKGQKDGPVVAILGCTHGDERTGALVLDWLLENIKPEKLSGEVRLILSNPAAYEKNIRYLDEDLNRLFWDENIAEYKKRDNLHREEQRVLELVALLEGVDYLVDVHATVKPTDASFSYVANTPRHHELAQLFNMDYLVCEKDESVTSYPQGPMDTYIDRQGGFGLTMEAGWKGNEDLFLNICEDMKRFFKHLDMYWQDTEVPESKHSEEFIIYKEMLVESDNFAFKVNYGSFDFIPEGEIIAYEGSKPVRVEKDSYIIFPKLILKRGSIAGYLAEKE